jgi:hypothetical protein
MMISSRNSLRGLVSPDFRHGSLVQVRGLQETFATGSNGPLKPHRQASVLLSDPYTAFVQRDR